ncbi:LexA family protein [Mogibacterium diversum]|mgnify:FL=1|uniref:LexA family protein n=1 Tax=Mogibacterium diversum TaxID=114527 RepID=UPI0026F0E145|nr:S24 family peptidase [Mogibacterium diversum]
MSFANNIRFLRRQRNISQEELAEMVGYKSFTTIQKWETGDSEPNMGVLRQLADIFHLSISELVETDLENKSSDRPLPSNIILPSAHKLPIMGTICAGDGVVCEDDYQGTFIVDIDVKADYCLKVHGDSMIGANIYDGDIVFISKSYDFVQDQIYAIERLDYNEASLKRVTQDGDTLILNPCNPEYHAMVTDYEEVRIIGRCVGVLHKYV